MFSPAANNGSQTGAPTLAATRGRRRQRPLSSESSQQPKAKRVKQERASVSDQTFVDPADRPENYEVKSTRSSRGATKPDAVEEHVPYKNELSVRSKKNRPGDRLNKGDGSTLLSTNNAFDVRKLPAYPDRLKTEANCRQHALLDSTTGYALSLTHTHAVVWPYATTTPSPEAFTFTLPYPSKHSTDPLPLGALIPSSASSAEPGLVVVMATSGKVTYWESISSATTLDFMRQQRNGVEGSISGMFSGEKVTQITNAESASGFVIAFSTGRMAHLGVRDSQGKPSISVQYLRTSLGPSSSGFFGNLRLALSHSALQGDITAVRSERRTQQGECTVVASTSKGRIHAWRMHRGGQNDLLVEVDGRNAILNALRTADQKNKELPTESLKILDFCFVPKITSPKYVQMSQLREPPKSDMDQHLLLLTSLSRSRHACRYNLVEVIVSPDASGQALETGVVRPITTFSTPPSHAAFTKPRVYLPRPNLVAFVVFDHAAIVASIGQPPESPESQIMEDNHVLPATFEDVVDLRKDPSLEIVGSGAEEPHLPGLGGDEARVSRVRTKNPAAILIVRGSGTLRVAVTDVERFASDAPPTVTAKTKLEQAVFFGVKEDNPLVFDVQHVTPFTNEEYGAAALALSHEILASNGPQFSSVAPRVEANLQERSRYLDKIMTQIKSVDAHLDRATKWQLLWNAEKLHVAGTLWRKHEEFAQLRENATRKKTIVAEIVEFIRNEEKSRPDVARGEVDQLRHWFIRDVDRMDLFIAWAYQVIKHNSKALLDQLSLARLIQEAAELYNSALRDAYAFRARHLEMYGLADEQMENGILVSNYAGLPEPWTCRHWVANNVKRHVELCNEWIRQQWGTDVEAQKELVLQTRSLLPELTEIYLTVLQELARSYLNSGDPKKITDGQPYQDLYDKDRHDKVVALASSESWEDAIKLAEAHRSLPALAEVLTREITVLREQLAAPGIPPQQAAILESRMADKEEIVRESFAEYGQEFAFPFYEYLFTSYGVDALLQYDGDKQYKTQFLRTKPELAKISWINDIVGEEDIDHAADTLLDLGLTQEQRIWNKKIELSLGKLARMAESSRPPSQASMSVQEVEVNGAAEDARVAAIDRELAIIEIQNELYDTQIRPVINVALDASEELGLVLEGFSLKHPKKYKILSQIFEQGMKRLLQHEALDPLTLIDILTLITLPADTKNMMADQFFLAIQVAYNGLSGAERVQAERLIWRRCFLREDWTTLNNTSLKKDNDVMDVLGQTELFQVYCTLFAHRKSATDMLHCDHSANKPVSEQNGDTQFEYARINPSDAAGVYTEILDSRFSKKDPGFREKLLDAMRWEDTNLRNHIEKHRLDEWAKETRRFAEEAVVQQYDESTADRAPASPKVAGRRKSKRSQEALEGQNGTH
ncbi:Nup133 N terminal like-domain-containing protein [Xylariomycetidae sp. FL0641]|nr:Nup133 N terminal like-domain-containing protein [Xylariomycetidae sp. FL0641]